MKRLAHISDLHIGRKQFEKSLKKLVKSIRDNEIDHTILTGDITEGGRKKEYKEFQSIFEPLLQDGVISIVPGNHDRLGDDIAQNVMSERVIVEEKKGAYIIKVDSTGPHNKWLLYGHGIICDRVLNAIDNALAKAPKDKLVVVALHHHPIPLPEEGFWERVATRINWPAPQELRLGPRLIELIKGKADLCLYGHRHFTAEHSFHDPIKTLSIYNAGCTPRWKKYRVFSYKDGELVKDVKWIHY